MKIVIIGNGILGLMTAYRLVKRNASVKVTMVGPADQRGCASLAAAAMFNSFAEIDGHTLDNVIERKKFEFNKLSNSLWPGLITEIAADSGHSLPSGFGTFVINNHISDSLEDENFDAIVRALDHYCEPYEHVNPTDIPHYKPSSNARAARAIFIKGEGWINPRALLAALKSFLLNCSRFVHIDAYCDALIREHDGVVQLNLSNGESISGDKYLLAPGATFSKIISNSNLDLCFPRIFYGIGSSVLLKTGGENLSNCVRTPNRGLACGIYAAPQEKDLLLIGASNLIAPEPSDHARITSVYTLLKSAMEQINHGYFRSEIVRINVGWRPTSEDTLPLLGETTLKNLFIATGTKRDGLHCSPIIADSLSSLLLDQPSPHDLTLFRPERTPVKIYQREEAIRIAVRHTINAAYQHDFVPSKNTIVSDLENYYTEDLNRLHDKVGAHDWGIPPEMINMYRYGHIH